MKFLFRWSSFFQNQTFLRQKWENYGYESQKPSQYPLVTGKPVILNQPLISIISEIYHYRNIPLSKWAVCSQEIKAQNRNLKSKKSKQFF